MKIKLSWDEFVGAAITELRNRYLILKMPKFVYDVDGLDEIPPAYVEIECEEKKVQ